MFDFDSSLSFTAQSTMSRGHVETSAKLRTRFLGRLKASPLRG